MATSVSLVMRVSHRCGQNFVLARNYGIMAWIWALYTWITLYIPSQDALHWFKVRRLSSIYRNQKSIRRLNGMQESANLHWWEWSATIPHKTQYTDADWIISFTRHNFHNKTLFYFSMPIFYKDRIFTSHKRRVIVKRKTRSTAYWKSING